MKVFRTHCEGYFSGNFQCLDMRVPLATSSDLETSPFRYEDDMEDTRALFFLCLSLLFFVSDSQRESHCNNQGVVL